LHNKFLTDLSADPRWEETLKYLEKTPPTYAPDEDAEDEKLKSKFIYESGIFNENKRILTILRGIKNDASHD
jgi:hypothetical protein